MKYCIYTPGGVIWPDSLKVETLRQSDEVASPSCPVVGFRLAHEWSEQRPISNKRTVSKMWHTVDGRNPAPVSIGSLMHYLKPCIHLMVVQDFYLSTGDQYTTSLSPSKTSSAQQMFKPCCFINLTGSASEFTLMIGVTVVLRRNSPQCKIQTIWGPTCLCLG